MDHRGEIVKETIESNGMSVTKLASILKVSTQTMYNFFKNEKLPKIKIEQIGKALDHDFSAEFPKLFGVKVDQVTAAAGDVFVKVTVELDGSLEKMEGAIEKIRSINNALNK